MGGKIKISAALEVVTGMHIGGSDMYSPIGAVDKPVVSDPRTGQPIVPGSSLKGKLRTLLVRSIEGENAGEPNDDPEEVKRLFGASAPKIMRSRLQFADAFVSNEKDFSAVGLTEVKFENAINRGTGVANPRQIERVVRGVQFAVCIVYDVPDDISEAEEDMKNFRLLPNGTFVRRGTSPFRDGKPLSLPDWEIVERPSVGESTIQNVCLST